MAKNKGKKSDKKARKEAERAAREEAERLAKAAAAKRKRILLAIPVLTAAAAAGAYFALENERLVGISVLIGGLLWLMVALGAVGGSIKPRDRLRSGSIDFGTRE